jgi:tight adherence protein B
MMLTMVLLFLALALGMFALLTSFDQRGDQARLIRERLAAVNTAAERNPSEELALLRDQLLSEIPALNRLLASSERISRLQRYLSQADVSIRAGKFLLLSTCSGVFAGILVNLLTRVLVFGALAFVAFTFIPLTYVSVKRSRRFHRFEALFPEAIDLLGRAVRAGHAFNTALEVIANEIADPVAGEFRKLFEELKFGLPMRDAMLNLVDRVPLIDVKFFVTSVLLQRETGGNLAEILDKLSYVIRERFKILRQVRVFTAQGRLTMAILMAVPPGIVLMLLAISPDFMRPLFTDPLGHTFLATGVVMQVIGFFLIRKIIHIKV